MATIIRRMPARTRYARASDGVRIAYESLGLGPAIVFASNVFGDLHFYRSLHPHTRQMTDGLVELGWSVVRYDLRGMGASDRKGFDMNIEGLVADLDAVIETLGLSRFVLAGLGAGATLASLYASRHLAAVKQLVLLNPFKAGLPFSVDSVGRTLGSAIERAPDDYGFFSLLAANLVTGFANPVHARDLAAMFQASTSPETLKAYQDALKDIDLSSVLSGLQTPTLIIHDTGFPMGSFEEREVLAAAMPSARLVVIPGDGAAELRAVDAFLRAGPTVDGAGREEDRSEVRLTRREIEVLRLIAQGLTNREIAVSLVLSERTVSRHIGNVYDKLDLRSKAEATAYALRHGIA